MSDIFISYSSTDRERARLMAHALEQRGWSVWWDREIPPGRAYDDVIEEALDAARCVVVLWSKASTGSSWVRNEASDAMQRKVLIPALIDPDVKIPLEFRRLQAADLSRWQGEASTEFEQFCEAVARNVVNGPGPTPRPTPSPAPAPGPQPYVPPAPPPGPVPAAKARSSKLLWIAGIVGVLFIAGLASVLSEHDSNRPMPPAGIDVAPLGNVAPAATPTPTPIARATQTPAPQAPSVGGPPGVTLAWRDHALAYNGVLTWDGRSNVAQLSVDVFDGMTGQSLGHRQLAAYGRPDAPGRNVFSAQVPVSGDSVTSGPHSHNVNLVFEMQANGNWVFARNCTAPNDCYEVRH